MTAVTNTLMLILNIAQWIVLIHVIMSWLINFQVLNLRQPLVSQIWYGLNRILDPIYSRIRSVLPNLGGLDLAPLIVLIAIFFLQQLLRTGWHSGPTAPQCLWLMRSCIKSLAFRPFVRGKRKSCAPFWGARTRWPSCPQAAENRCAFNSRPCVARG